MTSLVFDIDDTLYSRQDLFIKAASDVTGQDISKIEDFVDTFYRVSDLNTRQLEKGLISTIESNTWRFAKVYEQLGIAADDTAGLRTAQRYSELQEQIRLSSEMERTLSALRDCKTVELAIITAGSSEHQWLKYDRLGMERFIPKDKVIVAGDVGCSKPDVKIFRLMEDRLNEKDRNNIYMIGDSYKHDISGAVAAGWRSIWLNRRKKVLRRGDSVPDYEVNTEQQLLDLISEMILD